MKYILTVVFCFVALSIVYADTRVKTAVCTASGTYAISASSTTATLARDTNVERRGIAIYNNAAYKVYIATYAATSTTNLYPIPANSEFSDNIEAYSGAFYVLTEAGNASANVRIIEKTSSNY